MSLASCTIHIMARGDSKIDLRAIIRAHRASYVDIRTGKRRRRDNLLMEGTPAAVLGVCLAFRARLNSAASVGLLTVSFLLSALFFGLMLQISDRAMNWADTAPSPGEDTSEHALFLGEIAAHAGYAALVSILAAIAFVVASASRGWLLVAASAVGLALGFHLLLVLSMVMKRVFLLTQDRLNRARRTRGTPGRRAS
jgi:hypothetical protein